jgi:glutaredoxin
LSDWTPRASMPRPQRVIVLGRDTCEDTTRSRRYLDEHGIAYDYFRVDREPTADEWIRSLNNDVWVTPTILIGDPKNPEQILREPSDDELRAAIGGEAPAENQSRPGGAASSMP